MSAAVAAIQFALEDCDEDDDGILFLKWWNEGEFDKLRRNWADIPEEVFIGADPLHPGTIALQAKEEASAMPKYALNLLNSASNWFTTRSKAVAFADHSQLMLDYGQSLASLRTRIAAGVELCKHCGGIEGAPLGRERHFLECPKCCADPAVLATCHADRDGECRHSKCPQLRDKEPATSGRHCPLDAGDDE